jgi:hypothetical protein
MKQTLIIALHNKWYFGGDKYFKNNFGNLGYLSVVSCKSSCS